MSFGGFLSGTTMLKVITIGFRVALLCLATLGGPAGAAESITYIHNDIAGSPISATDASGNLSWRESYRPYGERLQNQAAAASNEQWFHGKSLDTETGLQYFGARYYDPLLGRFMGADPVTFDPNNIHSFNRYAYGNNNPYRYLDPNGAEAIPIAGRFIKYVPGVRRQLGPMTGAEVMADPASRAAALATTNKLRDLVGLDPYSWNENTREVGTAGESIGEVPPNVGPGSNADESIPAGPSSRPTKEQQGKINEIGDRDGCHTCGTKDPGTKSRNWIGDHQDPNKLNPKGKPQKYYPHCKDCSNQQGGRVRWLTKPKEKE